MTIKTNKAQCAKCQDIIESKHVHDYVTCKCGALAVDGGRDYLKRSGDLDNYIELSEEKEEMPSKTKKQHNLMEAAAHGAKFPMAKKIPVKVAKDFAKADKGKKFGKGGPTSRKPLSVKPRGRG